jgi:hypothetical protein
MRAAGTPNALVSVEDLAKLMQRAVAIIRQAFSFVGQYISSHGAGRQDTGWART